MRSQVPRHHSQAVGTYKNICTVDQRGLICAMQIKCGCIAGGLAQEDAAHITSSSRLLRLIQTQTIFPSFAPVGAGFPALSGSLTSFKGVAAFDVNNKASNGEGLVRVKKR